MTVIAGEPFTITVPYTANPKPRPNWSINGEEVLTGERIKFETTDVASQFINKKAKRSDTGTYTIYLTNTVGTDSASCKVLVVGKYPAVHQSLNPETPEIFFLKLHVRFKF